MPDSGPGTEFAEIQATCPWCPGANGFCFDPDAVAWLWIAHSAGWDHTMRHTTRFGLGYMPAVDNRWRPPRQRDSLLIGTDAFGRSGFGGTVGFADPTHGVAFGCTMNRMSAALSVGGRAQRLIHATYQSLGLRSTDSGAWR